MSAYRITGLAILLSCSALAVAEAGQVGVHPGAQVRITTAGSRTVSGTVLTNGPDGLVLDGPGHGSRIPTDQIRKLEVRTGGVSHGTGFLRGVGIGILAGATFGAVIGATSYSGPDMIFSSAGEAAAAGAVVFGIVGVPIGGLIGLAASGVDYANVPLESPEVTVSLAPSRDHDLVVATSWRF